MFELRLRAYRKQGSDDSLWKQATLFVSGRMRGMAAGTEFSPRLEVRALNRFEESPLGGVDRGSLASRGFFKFSSRPGHEASGVL